MPKNTTRERAASYETVIEILEEYHGQLMALASSLVDRLTPENPKDPEEDARLAEWRLAQVMEDMLGSTATIKGSIKGILMGGSSDASH